ncbi:MAG UNVERIFIED_CONTAM: hypothetical protein MIN83_26200 [Paenibacillus polymyxa]
MRIFREVEIKPDTVNFQVRFQILLSKRYSLKIREKPFRPSSKYPLPIIPGDVNTDMPSLLRGCTPLDPCTCLIQLGSISKTNRYREGQRTSTDDERVEDCNVIIGSIQ